MQKSLRLFVIAFSLVIAAVPYTHADQMGTNPHPAMAAAPSMWKSFVDTVASYLGI